MTVLLWVLAAWVILSVPIALVLGKMLRAKDADADGRSLGDQERRVDSGGESVE